MASIVARSQFVMERFTYQAAATSPGLMVITAPSPRIADLGSSARQDVFEAIATWEAEEARSSTLLCGRVLQAIFAIVCVGPSSGTLHDAMREPYLIRGFALLRHGGLLCSGIGRSAGVDSRSKLNRG